jgi:Domain of unknown function (DUF4129)
MERTVKAVGLVAGLVGLLALVAMAARGGHPGTSGHVATHPVPNSVQDSFVTLLAVVYVLAIVAIIFGFARYPHRFRDPESHWLRNFALVVLLMLVATAIGYYAITHGRHQGRQDKKQQVQGAPGAQRPRGLPRTSVPTREAHFEWPLVAGIGGLALLGGVWMYVRSRRRLAPLFEDRGLEADMLSAIETTIDDLRSERDPRRAVIAAYALMERTLARHGLARHRSEAPVEYLASILRGLRVRESAVIGLTRLFEYAKFSRHEIGDVMKEEAIDALIAIRDDLQTEETIAA